MREGSTEPPGVHVGGQDIGAAELSGHEAVAVQALGVAGRHLQEVVHSPHRHLIRGEVAHIQKGLELAFTEPELGDPCPAALPSLGSPGPDIVAMVEGGGEDVFWQEAWEGKKGGREGRRQDEARSRREEIRARGKKGLLGGLVPSRHP